MRPLDPRLLRYARATRRYLVACVALGVAGAAAIVAQAALLADGIAAVFLEGAALGDLRGTLLALAGVLAARTLLAWAQEVVAHRTAAAVKTELRTRLLAHVTRLGPGWLTGQRSGELTTLATRGVDALDSYFARYLPQLVLAAIIPTIVLARVLPTDLIAGLTIALTLPLIPVFMVLVGLATEAANRRQFRSLTRLAHHFLDVVAGLPTLKVFGRAKAQAATIRAVTGEYRRHTMRTLRVAFLSSLVLELIATLSVALVAVGIGLRLVNGSLDLRTALLVLVLAPEAYLPLRQVGAHYHASAEGLAAAEQVFAVLETAPPPAGTRTDLPDPRGGALRISDVTVSYPDRDQPVLERVSLTLNPGEVVALTGPSGAGKSTLLHLLLGFVRPQSGAVTLDAGTDRVDLADADPRAWRRLFTYVPQRPHLFAGSLADNIRLGHPEADDAAVRRAVRSAGLDDVVAALPAGLDTPLGERGVGLSAGQRQRVALARAFLRDAPVVLLDEPTSNLDGNSEAVVIDAVRRLAAGRTVLLVAHRPALLALADRIVTVRPAHAAQKADPAGDLAAA